MLSSADEHAQTSVPRTWRPPLPSALRGPRRCRGSTPGCSSWTHGHPPPATVFPGARHGRSLSRCGEITFRALTRYRAPNLEPRTWQWRLHDACGLSRLNDFLALWSQAHMPSCNRPITSTRSTWPNQARLPSVGLARVSSQINFTCHPTGRSSSATARSARSPGPPRPPDRRDDPPRPAAGGQRRPRGRRPPDHPGSGGRPRRRIAADRHLGRQRRQRAERPLRLAGQGGTSGLGRCCFGRGDQPRPVVDADHHGPVQRAGHLPADVAAAGPASPVPPGVPAIQGRASTTSPPRSPRYCAVPRRTSWRTVTPGTRQA